MFVAGLMMGDPIRLNVWNRSWKCLLHRSTEDVGAADRIWTTMVIVKSGKGRQMPRIEARKVPNPRCGHEVVPEGMADAPTRSEQITQASETGSEI